MSTATKMSLNLTRTYPVPVDQVWDAWTDPEKVRQWYAPGTFEIPEIEMDVRVNGEYRLIMHNASSGVSQTLSGAYREVEPARKLVYTWQWENDRGESPATLVTVTFAESDGETEVRIVHDLFPDNAMREQHFQGWTACLEQLYSLV